MLDLNNVYTISEVSEITGYAPHVLRYYEKEFELEIPRNNSNHRYFTYKEIELLQYIKTLQEKGFSNKQIKLIIYSPEILMNNQEGQLAEIGENYSLDTYEIAKEISATLEEGLLEKLYSVINLGTEINIKTIEELKDEIILLRNELSSKERDVLICENAKLKMKVKEKTYENVSLKDKLRRTEEKDKGLIKRIFSKK